MIHQQQLLDELGLKHDVCYGDAERRGQVRQWKQTLVNNYIAFDRAVCALSTDDCRPVKMVSDMIKCTRSGRVRAFNAIHKSFGDTVCLEGVTHGKNNRALALWSILKPRDGGVMQINDAAPSAARLTRGERASFAQDCVTVDYVYIGCQDNLILVDGGFWTLEVPDHALGRAVGAGPLDELVYEAHATLLGLPDTVLKLPNAFNPRKPGLYIKAGDGCFAGHFLIGKDPEGELMASFRVRTWLPREMLGADQVILSEKGAHGSRLYDGILRPAPMR